MVRDGKVSIRGLPAISIKGGQLPDSSHLKGRRVTVSLTYVEEATPSPVPDASVGIDMGVLDRLALSDGSMYPRRALDRDGLAEKQRRLSRCQ